MLSWNSQIARLFAEQKKALEAFVTRRTGSAQVAADLTQESFLRLARLDSGEKIDNLPAFLFTIASNLVRDHQRQAIRRERLDAGEPSEELPCTNPGADEQLAAYQQEQLMRTQSWRCPKRLGRSSCSIMSTNFPTARLANVCPSPRAVWNTNCVAP